MPICRGRYSCDITIVTPNVPITQMPTPQSANAPTTPPTATKTKISGAASARLAISTGRRPIRSASGPATIVPMPPASSISDSRWFPCAVECPSETSQSGTNVISPNHASERKPITPSSSTSAPGRFSPVAVAPRAALRARTSAGTASARAASPAIARHGSASSTPPREAERR